LHILSMSFMKRPCALRTPIITRGRINKTSLSKYGGKYLTSRTSILSKSIVIELDLDLLLDLVNFNALTIFKHEDDKE
jgi:hypothetical protein